MLGLFSKKSDHPLENLKSAQQLVDQLPKTDAVEVLHEIGHWIDVLFDPANEFRMDHQFAVLRMLDEAARPHLRKIINSYFAVVPLTSFQENRFWAAMNAYYTSGELGYLHLLMGAREGRKMSSGLKSGMTLICARGIHAIFGRLECAAARGAQIDPRIWTHLASFYDYAAAEQRLNEELHIYAGLAGSTSVSRQFAIVLAWYSIGVGALRPLSIHIAKRLITYMGESFTMSEQVQADSLFVFDLANPISPARVIDKSAMYPPGARFAAIGVPVAYFDSLLKTLNKNIVPEELNLGVAYNPEMVAEVARHLAMFCQGSLPVRRHPRRKIKMSIKVLDGFFNMLEQTYVDLNLSDHLSENWEVEDISANGLRCVVSAGQASNVKIGMLVGLQPEKALHWGVGIVRRLSRDTQNRLHVGVKILANRVECVVLHDSGGVDDTGRRALFLDRPDEQGGECCLLMKSDTFTNNDSPTMKLGDQGFLMLPLALEEKGLDFDMVRYRKMAKDNSGEEAY